MDWIIRKAGTEDSDAILQLLKQSFRGYWTASQSIFTKEFWNWLYLGNTAKGSINFVAESDGKIIGHFPNVLERLKVNENIYLSGIVLQLTTHPDYRNKGIFKNLGKASIEELSRLKIPFSFAFPNDKSRPGFTDRLGFFSIVTLRLLAKPLYIKNILKKIIKNPALTWLLYYILCPFNFVFFYPYRIQKKPKGLKIEARECFGAEFDSLWEQTMAQAKVMVPRDKAFLNWRFILRPNQGYQILAALKNSELMGYIVTRKADIFSLRVGIIMDYFVVLGKGNIFDALLLAAIDSFKKDGMDLCITACLKDNIYYRVLKNIGFVQIPEKLNPRKLVLVGRVNQDVADKDIFLDGKNWFLNFSDWDNF